MARERLLPRGFPLHQARRLLFPVLQGRPLQRKRPVAALPAASQRVPEPSAAAAATVSTAAAAVSTAAAAEPYAGRELQVRFTEPHLQGGPPRHLRQRE